METFSQKRGDVKIKATVKKRPGRPSTLSGHFEEIRRMYYDERMTQLEIGAHFGVSNEVVRTFMRMNGIPFRPRSETSRSPRGEKSPGWKGEEVSYVSLHRRVVKLYGRPKRCERCGLDDETRRYDWANLTGDYHNPTDYQRMCRSCHMRYDSERRKRDNHDEPINSLSAHAKAALARQRQLRLSKKLTL